MFNIANHNLVRESLWLAIVHVALGLGYYLFFSELTTYFVDYMVANGIKNYPKELLQNDYADLYRRMEWLYSLSIQIAFACLIFALFPSKLLSIQNIYYSICQVVVNMEAFLIVAQPEFRESLNYRPKWFMKNGLVCILFMLGNTLAAMTSCGFLLTMSAELWNRFRRKFLLSDEWLIK